MRTLIVKTGASGDVVRTTVLLRALEGEAWWLTTAYNAVLLPLGQGILSAVIAIEDVPGNLFETEFDLVICLEEDIALLKLIADIKTKQYIGAYYRDGKLGYTEDSAEWFNMSLISKFGKIVANQLKADNKFSYQQIMFRIIGKHFAAEKYFIQQPATFEEGSGRQIAIEKRCGQTWPNKNWSGYDELASRLRSAGHKVSILQSRTHLTEYILDISKATLVISGDSLAMHLAMACGIPCIAIFNCTSPLEIYDYGLLKKVISPMLYEVFYDTKFVPGAISAVDVSEVESLALNMI